jgi:hypothetical protein
MIDDDFFQSLMDASGAGLSESTPNIPFEKKTISKFYAPFDRPAFLAVLANGTVYFFID